MPKLVQLYRDWTIDLINVTQLDGIASRGAVPQVTWEPWDPGAADDVNQPAYNLQSIANGSHDSYLQKCAQQAKTYGKPFQLRFAPEMNGSWAPWEGSINGNTPALYVAAWQHVVGLFRAAGVTNVTWVWCPNAGPTNTIAAYWPGSSWVDMLSMDGYNWGSADVWQTWTQVFGPTYDIIAGLDATKPIQVGETACNQLGGDKAAWIRSSFLQEIAARFPRITDVVWFDLNKECDWRVDSSPEALAAFQEVAGAAGWGGSVPQPQPPPPTAPTGLVAPVLSVSGKTRNTVTLRWSAIANATGYTVEQSSSSSFTSPTDVQTPGTSVVIGGLARRTTYWFRAKATSASASSPWSAAVQVRTSR
jgi:hypothetical protein